jgi:hypothetical protein
MLRNDRPILCRTRSTSPFLENAITWAGAGSTGLRATSVNRPRLLRLWALEHVEAQKTASENDFAFYSIGTFMPGT